MAPRPLLADRYEPLALAGSGGQGEVWKARDTVHDRLVALKIRTAVDREPLLAEARTLLSMRPHDALPIVRDDFVIGDRYVIVMDWIDGDDLATLDALTFDDVLRHVDAVTRALDHLHHHEPPIVHGDVKPSNIVVTRDGRTVLVDLGSAAVGLPAYSPGTPAFVAPEIHSGDAATPASDVYSLAVTTYVLLNGDLPVPGRIPAWPRVPPTHRDRVGRAVARCLAFDPRERLPSAAAFASDLRPPPPPNTLPRALSSFVGREEEIVHVRSLLAMSRLVTLTGTGGCGKTRLAQQVAAGSVLAFDGAWLAELANVADDALVAAHVALAVGATTRVADGPVAAAADVLSAGRHLLLLDNCEHVAEGCTRLADDLLAACPELVVLATSREPLGVDDEAVHLVGALAPDEGTALFRARVPFGVTIGGADEPSIARICDRLGGIPLAIELAAAQLGPLDAAALDEALDEALGVLTGGARTNPRHETMRVTIDWSADRLEPETRAALGRLSVFAGGFTRASADEVCDAGAWLDALVRSSLLAADGARFRMLEIVRQYAADGLTDREGAELRVRHARWVAGLDAGPAETGVARLNRVAVEHDNIEAAMAHAVANDPSLAARIVLTAAPYWLRRDWNAGRRWVTRTLDVADRLDDRTHAALRLRAGDFAQLRGALAEARAHRERAVAISREGDDRHGLAAGLNMLGGTAVELGDLDDARRCFTESIDMHRSMGRSKGLANVLGNLSSLDERLGNVPAALDALEEAIRILQELPPSDPDADLLGSALHNLAVLHEGRDDWASARRCYEEALTVFDGLGNEHGRGYVQHALAYIDRREGRSGTARVRITESLQIAQRLGDRTGEAQALQLIGDLHRPDDLGQALEHHRRAVAIHRGVGSPLVIAFALARMGFVEVQAGDAIAAARTFGEAEAWYEAAGTEPFVNASMDDDVAWLKATLGPQRFEHEWAAGRRAASSRSS